MHSYMANYRDKEQPQKERNFIEQIKASERQLFPEVQGRGKVFLILPRKGVQMFPIKKDALVKWGAW